MNLQLSREDWLILDLDVTPRTLALKAVSQLRWDDGRPKVLDAELVMRAETHQASRRDQVHAVDRLLERWDGNLPARPGPSERELSRAGFMLARKLLGRGFLAELAPDGRAEFDVGVALASEDLSVVLRRMDGRCRPESMIARVRRRCGNTFVELFRTTRA